MQVHYDEGVATHIGLEPCAGVREDVGEAPLGVGTSCILVERPWDNPIVSTSNSLGCSVLG